MLGSTVFIAISRGENAETRLNSDRGIVEFDNDSAV